MKTISEGVGSQSAAFDGFLVAFEPLEAPHVKLLTDYRTNARYCECHIRGAKLVGLGTTDVPLDPEEQAEYRANRNLVEDAPAYERMLDDAHKRRTFSNIVAEYTTEFEKESPLKQFPAANMALQSRLNF
jgi:hypothetical protein